MEPKAQQAGEFHAPATVSKDYRPGQKKERKETMKVRPYPEASKKT